MKDAIKRAIANVVAYGDTDIFPFADDTFSIRDNPTEALRICEEIHGDLDNALSIYPPDFYDSFVPNGYTGFRWATQIDSFWNIYLLALVIKLGGNIESARIGKDSGIVHSYRFLNGSTPELWDRAFGWRSFYEKSRELSESSKYVVVCDVSEFYRRIYHHRLENALLHIDKSDITSRIMKILTVFSRQTSYGLPVGGPASRLLSELVLNQIDHLLHTAGYQFCRFADDYVISANDKTSAYGALLFISEKLQINQGLALQRAKTRILSSAEYRANRPLILDENEDAGELIALEKSKLFNLNVFYDPYSPTASGDYDSLKVELNQLDILYLLNHEIKKSRIHTATINRIVKALSYTKQEITDEAAMTIVSNMDSFYPCLSTVLITLNHLFDSLSLKTKAAIVNSIKTYLDQGSYLLKTEASKSFAIRLLARSEDSTVDPLLRSLYDGGGPVVRREVLSALSKRNQWMMISDLRHGFSLMSRTERRAMIIASYALRDEGKHWRSGVSKTFDPFERFTQDWMRSRQGAQP